LLDRSGKVGCSGQKLSVRVAGGSSANSLAQETTVISTECSSAFADKKEGVTLFRLRIWLRIDESAPASFRRHRNSLAAIADHFATVAAKVDSLPD
jgi:hypothetical protein